MDHLLNCILTTLFIAVSPSSNNRVSPLVVCRKNASRSWHVRNLTASRTRTMMRFLPRRPTPLLRPGAAEEGSAPRSTPKRTLSATYARSASERWMQTSTQQTHYTGTLQLPARKCLFCTNSSSCFHTHTSSQCLHTDTITQRCCADIEVDVVYLLDSERSFCSHPLKSTDAFIETR